ncbi:MULTISPECIES: L-rhamnose mutarotase [unclassified Micromonospora]|uniref:L-rhamnose mutarotase n=1 Tax=unclassified Micromonospora TaxID=2617518 RepID=UPI003A872260
MKRFIREVPVRRYCFVLRVRPDRLAEYRARHAAVWPEMLHALRAAGWHDYALFLHPDGLLVGHVRADDLAAAQAAMARTEVNARWQAEMAPFFTELGGRRPDEGFVLLEEIFDLDEQLAALDGPRPGDARSPRLGRPLPAQPPRPAEDPTSYQKRVI